MPHYSPLDIPVALAASQSDLLASEWSSNGIVADFIVPSDIASALRVSFDKPCIVRLVDEMPLSTEDNPGPSQGFVGEHFAYLVEGAAFAAGQSQTWKQVCGPVSHWRFITGWTCMDVLSAATPLFSIVPRQ